MQVGDPTVVASAVSSAQVLPVRPAVREAGEGRTTERDRREAARDGGTSFRATLDAALPEGFSAQSAVLQRSQAEAAPEAQRREKRPTSTNIEIDGSESAQLFSDRMNARADVP